jgi:hypothetical protein
LVARADQLGFDVSRIIKDPQPSASERPPVNQSTTN